MCRGSGRSPVDEFGRLNVGGVSSRHSGAAQAAIRNPDSSNGVGAEYGRLRVFMMAGLFNRRPRITKCLAARDLFMISGNHTGNRRVRLLDPRTGCRRFVDMRLLPSDGSWTPDPAHPFFFHLHHFPEDSAFTSRYWYSNPS